MDKKLLVGISTKKRTPSEQELKNLKANFAGKCDFCGVKITEEMAHVHDHERHFYNSCSLCFYYEHLDKIPHPKKGVFINWYAMTQQELNILVSVIWSMQLNAQFIDITDEYEDNLLAGKGLLMDLKYRGDAIKAHFLKGEPTNIEAVTPEIVGNYLHLLSPDDYHNRHKMFSQFLWFPPKEAFEKELAYWAKEVYNFDVGDMMNVAKSFAEKYELNLSER